MEITCPIRSVDLPGVADVELQGLIVVIGPNSSGKTQFLHDVDDIVCGRGRQLVVTSSVQFRQPPPFEKYFDILLRQGSIRKVGSADQFSRCTFQYGSDMGAGSFNKSIVAREYGQFQKDCEQKMSGYMQQHIFLKEIGVMSCSALFLKNRLTLMDECNSFDWLKEESPSRTLQSLHVNKAAKHALNEEISKVFQCALWINERHNKLATFVSNSPTLPSADDRLEPEIVKMYRTIETEGDGLRSYSAICATLLLEERPLCLIDEPEMCLHPPQAHAMGRFIGNHTSGRTCTVVATHSSHVLRGILETNPNAQVIRLTRNTSGFEARKLNIELLNQATSKPRSRSEAILEGLLSHAVIMCEAEGDRIVYESAYRTLQDRQLDIRLIASEGTGGFADPLCLYKALEVPRAVIADLDFLAKNGELKKVLTELGTPPSQVQELCKRAHVAVKRIRSGISYADPGAIQDQLTSLAQTSIDPSKDGDAKLRGKLIEIADRLYKLHDLKRKGLEAIPKQCTEGSTTVNLREEVKALLTDLQTHGLFLVPVGELESWLYVLMKGQSREDKSRWAMFAAEKIEEVGEREGDIWEFVRAVYDFLKEPSKQPKTSPFC